MNLTPTSTSSLQLLPRFHFPTWISRFSFVLHLKTADLISLVLSGVGLMAIIGGVLFLVIGNTDPLTPEEVQAASKTGVQGLGQVTVSVTGAVAKPGLYTLADGDRVAQALEKAGNLLPQADLDQVGALNLAEKVRDGQQIHISFQISSEKQKLNPASNLVSDIELININTATQKKLETLTGIGAVRAEAIIENRPYQSPQELVTKEVVTDSMFEKIKSAITI